jgi:hypothetical protein
MGTRRIAFPDGEHAVIADDGDAAGPGRRVKRQD